MGGIIFALTAEEIRAPGESLLRGRQSRCSFLEIFIGNHGTSSDGPSLGESKSMGYFDRNSRQGLNFPDEFGEDLYQAGLEGSPDSAPADTSTRSMCGYLTPTWFGPFLLSPLNQRERGFC